MRSRLARELKRNPNADVIALRRQLKVNSSLSKWLRAAGPTVTLANTCPTAAATSDGGCSFLRP